MSDDSLKVTRYISDTNKRVFSWDCYPVLLKTDHPDLPRLTIEGNTLIIEDELVGEIDDRRLLLEKKLSDHFERICLLEGRLTRFRCTHVAEHNGTSINSATYISGGARIVAPPFNVVTGNGAEVYDPLVEAQKQVEELQGLFNRHQDKEVVKQIRREFELAAENEQSVLVYLYSIREIIGSDRPKAEHVMKYVDKNISSATVWKELGRLCNEYPVEGSRHRGQKIGELKQDFNAIAKARECARLLTIRYLNLL